MLLIVGSWLFPHNLLCISWSVVPWTYKDWLQYVHALGLCHAKLTANWHLHMTFSIARSSIGESLLKTRWHLLPDAHKIRIYSCAQEAAMSSLVKNRYTICSISIPWRNLALPTWKLTMSSSATSLSCQMHVWWRTFFVRCLLTRSVFAKAQSPHVKISLADKRAMLPYAVLGLAAFWALRREQRRNKLRSVFQTTVAFLPTDFS